MLHLMEIKKLVKDHILVKNHAYVPCVKNVLINQLQNSREHILVKNHISAECNLCKKSFFHILLTFSFHILSISNFRYTPR